MSGWMHRLVALVVVAATIPLWLLVMLLIKLEDDGPVFFVQDRVGLRGRPFRLIKFRTMIPDAERKGLGLNVSREDARITRAGTWLRRWSLDELPQLLNVLKGDMNLVGPRPALAFQAERYTPEQRRRLEVPPGLTGWAQVNGRNALSWTERIRADVWYVDHRSWMLDLKILFWTPMAVLRVDGLYERNAGLTDEMNRPADGGSEDRS